MSCKSGVRSRFAPPKQGLGYGMEKSQTGGWGSPTAKPLERFEARVKRALADPTIQKVTVPIDELKTALEALPARTK